MVSVRNIFQTYKVKLIGLPKSDNVLIVIDKRTMCKGSGKHPMKGVSTTLSNPPIIWIFLAIEK